MTALYIAELVAYDPGVPGTVTLRYATGRGFVTGPAETPANTFYDGRIAQPALITRDLFGSGTTFGKSRVGFGDLVLLNGDGELDALRTYGFDGRAITIRRGEPGAAYPGGFTTVLVATMDVPEFGIDTVTIKLRDRQREVQVPLQTTKYAGDNVLPAGLEGTADDLEGKPKPVCLGVVKNVPAVLVNTSKLIYQVHDGAIQSLDAVYDRGIAIGLSRYVAIGWTGTTPLVSTSEDLVTWTARTWAWPSGGSYQRPRDLAYGAGLYVAVGNGGTIYTSPDGVTWTSRTSAIGDDLQKIVWNGSLFVCGSRIGNIQTSSDGITWTSRTSGFGTEIILGLAWGASLFVAVSGSGNIRTSPDGITWTGRTSPFGGAIYDVKYGTDEGPDVFIACGASGEVARSADGISWGSLITTTLGTNLLSGVAMSPVRCLIVDNVNSVLNVSNVGLEWTAQDAIVSTAFSLDNADYAGDRFLLYGNNGKLFYSTNAETWTDGSPGFGGAATVEGIAHADGLAVETYASEADLLDDTKAPGAGSMKYYAAGAYFRLGASPAGLVTADVTQGATAADRTAGQLFTDVLDTYAGLSSADWNAADITALDSANNSELGFWQGLDETSCEEVLNAIAETVGAWWGVDRAGDFRIKQFTAPSGSAVVSFTAADLLRPLDRIRPSDTGRGLPVYLTIVRWGRVYAVQDTDLAGAVTDAHRALVSKEWREVSDTDATVQTTYLLAPQTIEHSLLTTASDAQDEADRRQTLRGTLRDVFSIVVPLDDDTEDVDLGDVVELTHDRYGLDSGKAFRVLRLAPNAAREELALTIWG